MPAPMAALSASAAVPAEHAHSDALPTAGHAGTSPVTQLAKPVLGGIRQLAATLASAFMMAPSSKAEALEDSTTIKALDAEAPPGRRFAYVTLLTKDAYLPGVQALYRSLRLVGGRHPFVCIYTQGVGQAAVEALLAEGCIMQLAEPFQPDGVDHSEYKRALYMECWSKLRMWEMVEYDRLVYLDADMILLRDIDHLFELPPGFHAVGDCWGGREFEEERTNCCFFHPEATPPYFNAGFYVMTPSLQELAAMKEALAEGRIKVQFFAEQDFLNGFFQGAWHPLPYILNAQKRIKYHHPDLWRLQGIHIIHYVDEKPWSHRYSEENLAYREECDYWWDVFEGRLPPQKPTPLPAALSAGQHQVPSNEPSSPPTLCTNGALGA